MTKQNVKKSKKKNAYLKRRMELNLSREKASELLESIPPERIERIENEKVNIHPDEVLIMAEKYKMPSLCNNYCANDCPIGQQYVPEIKINNLSQIVMEMVVGLNKVQANRDRLMEITVDGKITDDELEEFVDIQKELKRYQ
ncbi:helix-turn-helix transcriptional regulator [Coprobacillaceae bacterium CR2/5/TPMF4]|nr:helix-turn-helix transcriptional regulator [Coprobacillaceae bacterium CR2/5/TPMF4]